MASEKITLRFNCGCEQVVKVEARKRDLAWRVENVKNRHNPHRSCWSCSQKSRYALYAEENRVAAADALDKGYAELEGSQKQIVWATTLRMKAVEQVAKMAEGKSEVFKAQAARFTKSLLSHTDSVFWIESRRWFEDGLSFLLRIEQQNFDMEEIA